MTRQDVIDGLAKHYTAKFGGKVWACYDPWKRKYQICGDRLPPHPDLAKQYPNGWSLLDYLTPRKAREIVS